MEASEILLEAIVTPLKDIPEKIWNILLDAVTRIIQWGIDTRAKGQEAIEGFINDVTTFLSELPEKAAYWLGYAIGTFIN